MSIATQISRLTTLRNNIRTKLIALGVISSSSAKLQDCYDGINGITGRSSSDLTASGATVTVPKGYYNSAASKSISNGSATTPATTITSQPTITVSSDGLITASNSKTQSVTPTVSAGYVSSGTAGTITVSGSNTKQMTVLAATTYNTSSTDRTIASGSYITGVQTIKGVSTSGISAANIKDGVSVTVGDAYDADRIVGVTGTFTDASTVSSGQTAASASKILSGYSAWVDGSEVKGNIATKTSSDMTVSGATVTAPAGYYASNASKSVASGSATTPATTITSQPTISVSSGGLITATNSKTQSVTPTVTAGYVSSGTAGTITVSGSNTSQLTTKGATTYTPTTTNQTIASGTYLTGVQTIKGDANLTAENIAEGVTVFGIEGTYKGGIDVSINETQDSHGGTVMSVESDDVFYQPVEWIKSNNKIDLGIKTKNTMEIECKFYRENDTAQYIYLSDSGSSLTTNTTAYLSPSGGNWRFGNRAVSVNPTLSSLHTSVHNNTSIKIDGTTVGTYSAPSAFTSVDNLSAFSSVTTSGLRIYSLKVKNSGVVVLNVVPVREVSTGKLGFYDLVGGGFYTNNSATITAGDDVDDPLIRSGISKVEVFGMVAVDLTSDTVTPNVMLSGYKAHDASGSEITGTIATKTSSDMTVSGATVTAPAGYYASAQSKSVATGSISASATGSATVDSLTYTYNSSSGKFGVTGSKAISGTATATVGTAGYVSSGATGSTTGTASVSATVNKIAGSTTISGTQTTTPAIARTSTTATGATNVGSGTASTTKPTSGYFVSVKSDANKGTLTATPSVSTAGYGTSSYHGIAAGTATVGAEASAETYITVPSGSATTPATTITSNPSISVNASGLITASNSKTQNVTPTVSAGYVSSGTAGTITVSGSNTQQLTTKAAATYNTSSSDQTISSGQYLTGAQTIKAVTTSGISAGNVKSGVTVKVGDANDDDRIVGVTGTFTSSSTVSSGQTAASAGQILSGYSAWVNGSEVQGSVTSKSAQNYTPSTTSQTILAGQYLGGDQTILGDVNLVSANIIQGVTIFGVAGSVPDGSNALLYVEQTLTESQVAQVFENLGIGSAATLGYTVIT